ncbi:MAG: DUF58 domain-containing protein [Sphingobacteriales bacterium]|nr:MAG: DUF58 domain-containing protein [Sphingobacteriales bacterium]
MANPNLEKLDMEQLRQFGSLELLAKQVVEGFIVGLHKSPFHGFSVEFLEHRLYNTGESTKHIDWKLYGRTDKLFVKRYEEETNLRCHIVIDNSSSMYFPEKQFNKIQFSVYAASALIYLLKGQRDAAGLSFFSNEIEKFFPSRSNNVHMKLLYTELERLLKANQHDKKSAAAQTLHSIAERIHKRSMVVIFSDMLDSDANEDEIFQALQHLKYNKHEVVLFHVMDKSKEYEFNFENRPYQFIDIESGEKVKVYPSEVKDAYLKGITDYRNNLKSKCTQYRIDYVEADINEGFRQVLLPYLVKRIKMK